MASNPAWLATKKPAQYEEPVDVRWGIVKPCSDETKQLAPVDDAIKHIMNHPHRSLIYCTVRDIVDHQKRSALDRVGMVASVDHFRPSTSKQYGTAGSSDPRTATTTMAYGFANGVGKEQVLIPHGITIAAEVTTNNNGVGRVINKANAPMYNSTGKHVDARAKLILDAVSAEDIANDPTLKERIYPELRDTGAIPFLLDVLDYAISSVVEFASKGQYDQIRNRLLRRLAQKLQFHMLTQVIMNRTSTDQQREQALKKRDDAVVEFMYLADLFVVGQATSSAAPGTLMYVDLMMK